MYDKVGFLYELLCEILGEKDGATGIKFGMPEGSSINKASPFKSPRDLS